MGSEGPSGVTFHVTGFKKFHGVPQNPTETIVNNLKGYIQKKGSSKGFVLRSCTILEAAGEGARDELYKTLESSLAESNDELLSTGRIVWIHFGVDGGATRFAIENQAVNEATFLCPDELGWKPQRVPIISEDGCITGTRKTTLPVKDICRSLAKLGYDIIPSDDADRFVCNYVYYHSLCFSEKNGTASLFVHVPPFMAIDEETQMQFVASLFEVLASLN